MKFKKFLIIILSVALLSCFAVSTFATDSTTAATIPDYGFYISPGDYVFDERVTDVSSFSLDFNFTCSDSVFVAFSYVSSNPFAYYFYTSDLNLLVYNHDGWIDSDYRYITVTDGFYIYDINIYQWWQSNVTRVDSGYDSNLLDGILSSFTFFGEWIAGAANAVTPMFWDGEALTVVGTLSVAGLSFSVVFLLIALVSSFMKFRS